jgi:hypothetical protein
MRISLDLDGVIAGGYHWYWEFLHDLEKRDPDRALKSKNLYYNECPLLNHPNKFLSLHDSGCIITAREEQEITNDWLERHGIYIPIYYISNGIDWDTDFNKGSQDSALLKAELISRLSVDVHIDNNPVLVEELRRWLPDITVILYGGLQKFY